MTAYFVDFNSGIDTNSGLSDILPWKTLPGTRTTDDVGWLNASWGSVSSGAKLQPGDTIDIKGGGKSTGGRVAINSEYYADGTDIAPIDIRVSDDWGQGPSAINGAGSTIPAFGALLTVDQRDYIKIGGTTDIAKLLVMNSNNHGFALQGLTGTHNFGAEINHLAVVSAESAGVVLSFADDWIVKDSECISPGTYGFGVGSASDNVCNNGLFLRCQSSYAGTNNTGTLQHGFANWGSINTTYVGCESWGCIRDGFDFGSASNASLMTAQLFNCYAHGNGEDGFAANGGSVIVQIRYTNCLAKRNAQSGFNLYEGIRGYYVGCGAEDNGEGVNFAGNWKANGGFDRSLSVYMEGCAGKAPRTHANVYSFDHETGGGTATTNIISGGGNVFVGRESDTEVGFETPFGVEYTYDAPPSWVHPTDKIGRRYNREAIAQIASLEAAIGV